MEEWEEMTFKNQQKKLRRELYALLAEDHEWHRKPDTELYKRITNIGQQLVLYSEDCAKRTINKEEYLRLRKEGYTIRQIASVLHVGLDKLTEWRKKNQIEKI